MGCGGSKPEAQAENVPAKLRPLLQSRIEKIKRRQEDKLSVSSQKVTPAPWSDETPPHNDKTVFVDQSFSDHKPCKEVEKQDMVVDDTLIGSSKVESDQHGRRKNSREDGKSENKEEHMEMEAGKTDDDNKEDESEEDESLSSVDDGAIICPGSPSFRVYFSDSLTKSTNGEANNDKTPETKNKVKETRESLNCNEATKHKKKASKLWMVIPKRKQVAVMNLLTCYNPAFTNMDKTAHLLAPKAIS